MHFDDGYDPYKVAYGSMPAHASANPDIKQLYIDSHFCYAYKVSIVTNDLGIVRSICFYNKDFFGKHPEIVINKKSNSPDEDKSVHDARLLQSFIKSQFPNDSCFSIEFAPLTVYAPIMIDLFRNYL